MMQKVGDLGITLSAFSFNLGHFYFGRFYIECRCLGPPEETNLPPGHRATDYWFYFWGLCHWRMPYPALASELC